jgi:hypothetical protein
MSLIFSNLVVIKTLSSNHRMYNLYAKFVKILEICKQFSENLVNDSGNVPRRGPVPKFSDLEVVALSLTAETESIDSEKWLFDYKLQEYKDSIPNLISRRQFNDRRKKTSGLCEELRKRIASVGLQEENVARWGVLAISRKLPTSASVLRRTRIILVISYTLSVG